MDRLVPVFILEQYAAGNRSGRFSATALFVDLSNFSTITNTLMMHGQHGAEVLATTMRAIFDPLVRIVYQQGGFITGFAGDAFTAVFPATDRDGSLNALAAAWHIGEQMHRQSNHETLYGTFESFVKCGLALGEVGWGIVTSADTHRASYYFAGSAVDAAAAAEKHARAGEIILNSALTHALVGAVELEAVGDYFRLLRISRQLPPPRQFEPPPLDPDLLHRFLDTRVSELRTPGEFRQVVNVLISLPTVRTTAQLAIFTRTLFALQERYGGLLNRLDFGDKGAHLVMFWGAPVAYENDVERALNFILDLQTQTAIPLNAGVTYRIAHAGCIGGEWHSEYTCYGRGINLAARFMTTAPRGEIWVDENIVRRVAARFDFVFAGEMSFKGFPETQKVYVLVEQKESVEPFYDGLLVGRKKELQQLADFVQPLSHGECPGLMMIWGEPGIGKSRLVHAFHTSPPMMQEEFLWALCQTDEILRHSLNPFRYWLRHYFGISASLSEARNKRSFNRKLDELIAATADEILARDLDGTRSFLGALVELRWPDSLYEALDPQARYENTFLGLIALLRAESVRQPLLIFLEDAHWLDQDTKAFLPRLLQMVRAGQKTGDPSYPLAILATARPEEAAHPLTTLAQAEIDLGPLDGGQLARQVEALLGGTVTRRLLDIVIRQAEGNPFFAEQLIRYLREEALLEMTADGWDLKSEQHLVLLPADVRALLVARLDRLPQPVREVVETAAALGREFQVRLLSQMLAHPPSLSESIEAAARAGIWSPTGELRYLFKHALLRDTAYRTQVRVRREALHGQAVIALETLFAGDLAGHYGELAYHSERGQLVEKARHYLQLAGEGAHADYQNSLALDYYERALSLTPAADLEGRYTLHLARERILRLLGKQEERQETLQALAELAAAMANPEKTATVHLRQGILALDLALFSQAFEMTEKAAALAREAGVLPVLIEAQVHQAMALLRQGGLEPAARLAEEGAELAQKAGDRRAEARFLNVSGLISIEREAHEAAEAYFTRSLAAARAAGERRLQALPLNNLGLLAGHYGDFATAQRYYQQALRISREIGERRGEGLVLGNLGWLADHIGEYEKAQTYYQRALRILREVDDRFGEAYGLINLGACLSRLGDTAAALRYATEALHAAQEMGDRSAEAWARTYLGHSHLATGAKAAATAAYREALAIRHELQQAVLATEPAAGLAAAHLAAGEQAAAQTCLQEFLPALDGSILEGTDDPLRIYHTAYRVLVAMGDPRAQEILIQAYQILQDRARRIKDEQVRRNFLERNPSHRAICEAWEQLVTAGAAGTSGPPTDGRVPPVERRF